MAERVYLETSIISYLAAHPSRDLITAARQQITHEWWNRRRIEFEVYVSEIVVAEAAAGDTGAAHRRTQWMVDVPSLSISDEATALARKLVHAAGLPDRAAVDALHIAVAASTECTTCSHGTRPISRTQSSGPRWRGLAATAGTSRPCCARLTNSWESENDSSGKRQRRLAGPDRRRSPKRSGRTVCCLRV
ncbi:MAG: type II toxin-antitoxin system VapC family toxin [Burkholderiales bacterium]|nr:type II toxin-antitoxin system VapC family toxin [Burkholderiales bacterium]